MSVQTPPQTATYLAAQAHKQQQTPAQEASPYAPETYPQLAQSGAPYPPGNSIPAEQPGTSKPQPGIPQSGNLQQPSYTAKPVYNQSILSTIQVGSPQPELPTTQSDHPNAFNESSEPKLNDYEIQQECEKLYKAMKGFGTNENAIIEVLASHRPSQMTQICEYYQTAYKKSLVHQLESETSGNFRKLCVSLTYSLPELDARGLHNAMRGFGTDEAAITEILVGRTNSEINAIKQKYNEIFRKDLEHEIKRETGGVLRKLFLALLEANRDEKTFNPMVVESDVDTLYKAGEGKFGTNESEFVRILTTRSEQHLHELFKQYQMEHQKTMEDVLYIEFSGDVQQALTAIVRCINDRPTYIANLFEEALKAKRVNDNMLIRLVSRYRDPKLMEMIKSAYQARSGRTLCNKVKEGTKGDYEKLLVEIIKP